MGSGGQKAHEAIAIAPSAVAETTVEDLDASDLADLADTGVIDDIEDLVTKLGPDDYDSIATMAQSLADEDYGLGEELPEHVQDLKDTEIKLLTKTYLNSLEPGDLQQLAADHGFEHPTLVGLDETSPLAHWLDPAYPDDIASKLKIQAKANERYQALQAGETINGQTLDDVKAAEAALGLTPSPPPIEWEPWDATPAEVATAMADVTNRAVGLQTLHTYNEGAGNDAAALITAENKLQTANCPELGDSLDEMKASASQLVSQSTIKITNGNTAAALADAGLLTSDEAKWLAPAEALAAARYSSGPQQVAELKSLATARADVINQLQAHKEAGIATPTAYNDIDLSTTAGRQQLLATLNATQDAFALTTQAHSWNAADQSAVGAVALHGKFSHNSEGACKGTTKDFRAWAKTQKLGDLRSVAETAGLSEATKGGTRADIQNYLAGQWDTSIDQAAIEAKVKAKSAGKASPAPSAPTSSTTSPPSPPPAHSSTGQPATSATGPGRFSGKLGTLTAKLKAHQQITADLPGRTTSDTVAAHDWGNGEAWSKGSHESSLHTGPDGSQWMFKPDKSAKGARAQAEAAASNVFNQVGVPGVDVHVATIGKRTGAIQPLVKGASNLDGASSSWSQADVDSMVRLHVAAWAVGDHDGHTSNVMRSPSGAIFAVDQGQAFKFFGRDQLDHAWKPSGNYGTPVYHQAYTAAQHGGLGSSVQVRAKAALPVIKAFEALPDAKYRTMLTPTATEGVKHGVHWVEPMRKAAQKRLGKSTVTNAEIADEFLTTAVERKNTLRSAFAGFFGALGVDDAQHLTWVK